MNWFYTAILIAIFLLVGTLDADTQMQIEKAAVNPKAHGAVWNEPAETWDYPEARSYEF